MIDQKMIFWMTVAPWLMIIGMTIIIVFVNWSLYRLYHFFSPQKQFSQKINKIALIFGLVVFSLIVDSAWLFSIRLLTS